MLLVGVSLDPVRRFPMAVFLSRLPVDDQRGMMKADDEKELKVN
jgi:hypothetical protein